MFFQTSSTTSKQPTYQELGPGLFTTEILGMSVRVLGDGLWRVSFDTAKSDVSMRLAKSDVSMRLS